MFDWVRRLFRTPRLERGKPAFIVHRKGKDWGVVVLHGGLELHWYEPEEMRREALHLLKLAELASNPGYLPGEQFG